jgi:hypothetical protein
MIDLIPEYGQAMKFKFSKQIYHVVDKRVEHSQLLHKTLVMYRLVAKGFDRWIDADRLVPCK